MSQATDKRIRVALIVVLALLVAILLLLLTAVIHDYIRAEALGQVEAVRTTLSNERRAGPLSKPETGDIAGWMTFDYINYLFALPSGYLQAAVPVKDPAYPHLSLNSFARHTNQGRAALVQAVQSAVAEYLK